jgi:hypothetical protein
MAHGLPLSEPSVHSQLLAAGDRPYDRELEADAWGEDMHMATWRY